MKSFMKNIEKIHKCKRKSIIKALRFIDDENKNGTVISKVVIFGSAVTADCRKDSDIDICLSSTFPVTNERFLHISGRMGIIADDVFDVFESEHVDGLLESEIFSNGVVVYEKTT